MSIVPGMGGDGVLGWLCCLPLADPATVLIFEGVESVTGQLPKAVYSRWLLENEWCNRDMRRGFVFQWVSW
jgi:hypothetical protein